MFGAVLFGDGKDRIVLFLGGIVFLIAGGLVWTPVFPGVVNRIRSSKSRRIRKLGMNAPGLLMVILIMAMGLVPMLSALNIIPTADSKFPAPRWVAFVAGSLFVLVAIYLALQPTLRTLSPEARKRVTGLFPLLIVSGMAAIADWIAFGPGVRAFGMGAGNGLFSFWTGGGEWGGRLIFGLSGVFLTVAGLIAWWKYLRNNY